MTCGHEWDAQGTSFFSTRRAARWDRCARSKAGQSHLLGAGSLDSSTKSFGGERLPKKFSGGRTNMSGAVTLGMFLGGFNNMKFPNEFCSECDKAKN